MTVLSIRSQDFAVSRRVAEFQNVISAITKVEFDSPLAHRFDETDSMVMCDEVKVPWEKVFVHNDAVLARDIYIKTPAHCYGNHQSNVRFHEKMQLLVREEIAPLEDKLDPDASQLDPADFDRLVRKVKDMGLYGLGIPPEFGGPDIDIVTMTPLTARQGQ